MINCRLLFTRCGVFASFVKPFDKSIRSLDRTIVPLKLLCRRSSKEDKKARGVGTVFCYKFIGINRIAFGLTHLCAIFEYHPLCEQPLKRLIEINITEVS